MLEGKRCTFWCGAVRGTDTVAVTNSAALLYFEFCLKKCIVLNLNQYKSQSNKKISQNQNKMEIGTVLGVAFLLVQIAEMVGSEIDIYDFSQASYFWVNPCKRNKDWVVFFWPNSELTHNAYHKIKRETKQSFIIFIINFNKKKRNVLCPNYAFSPKNLENPLIYPYPNIVAEI